MKRPAHRGWIVVAAVFAVLTVCSGLGIYGLSVYLHAFVAEGRFRIEQVSFATATFSVASGLVGLWVGQLLDRYDSRSVITAGALMMAAAFAALPLVRNLPALYAFYAVLGVGYGASALIPCTTIVTRWFLHKRALALSIAATGNSFGAVVLTPPVAALVAAFGMDGAAPWLAIALLLGVLPLTWWVLRGAPQEVGLLPYGAQAHSAVAPTREESERSYRFALRHRLYWASNIAFMCGMAAHFGGQAHLFNLWMLRHGSTGQAGAVIATMATASVLARFGAVWALERMSARTFIAWLLATQGLALAGIGLADSAPLAVACVILYGSTLGNFVTAQSLLLAEAFGVSAYARLYGLARVVGTAGVMVGPGLMGLLYASSQSYTAPYIAVGAVSVMGIAALLLAGPDPSPAEPSAQGVA